MHLVLTKRGIWVRYGVGVRWLIIVRGASWLFLFAAGSHLIAESGCISLPIEVFCLCLRLVWHHTHAR
jgi:hypothetical protein